MDGSARKRVAPACCLRCMCRAASEGDMTSIWWDDLDAWIARQRPRSGESIKEEGGRVVTRQS
eukprot:5388207-Pleurochrysis_carterae.AAC.1